MTAGLARAEHCKAPPKPPNRLAPICYTAVTANIAGDEPEDTAVESSIWAEVVPLLSFSAQTLCIAITSPVLSLVDTSVVGLTSEAQLAAMAPATSISDGLYYMLTFIPIATTNLVSLHMSRKHPDAAGAHPSSAPQNRLCKTKPAVPPLSSLPAPRIVVAASSLRSSRAGAVVSDALAIAVAVCAALTVVLLVGAPAILSSLAPSMSPDMLQHAVDYVRIRALGLPFALAYSVMQVCMCLSFWVPGRTWGLR